MMTPSRKRLGGLALILLLILVAGVIAARWNASREAFEEQKKLRRAYSRRKMEWDT